MADDKAKTDYRDRDRINVHEEYELSYWANELRVTPEKLTETAERVGAMVTNVREALGKKELATSTSPVVIRGQSACLTSQSR